MLQQRPGTESFTLYSVSKKTTFSFVNALNAITSIKVAQDSDSHCSITWMLLKVSGGGGMVTKRKS